MIPINVAVFVSGGGTNLQALIDADLPDVKLALVLSNNPKAYALTRAKNCGVPTEILTNDEFDEKVVAILREYKIELVALGGFLRILREDAIKEFPKRIINVHPSLIPSFCGKGFYGLKVHEAALERGVKISGATVHYVNEIPDGGEIILQKAVDVLPGDAPETLQKRIMREAERIIFPQAVKIVCEKIANPSY
jgi:phosphoribosylglycinamide formyltransferase-1